MVRETLRIHYRKKGQAKVLRDEIVAFCCHPKDENGRKVTKETLEGGCYQFYDLRYP